MSPITPFDLDPAWLATTGSAVAAREPRGSI
jgi:hypothetical protein